MKRGQSEPDSEYGEFFRLYLEARAVLELSMLDIVTAAATADWRAAQAVLRALAPGKWGGRNERLERATARKAEAEADQAEALARRAQALAAQTIKMATARAPTISSPFDDDDPDEDEADAVSDKNAYALPAPSFWQGPRVDWPDISCERVISGWLRYRKPYWRGAVEPRALFDAVQRVAAAHADFLRVAEDAIGKLIPDVLWRRFERLMVARGAFVPCEAAGPVGTPDAPSVVLAPMPDAVQPRRLA